MQANFIDLFCLLLAPFTGGFLSVIIMRVPENREWVMSRSACGGCGTQLRPWDLIPLVSWALAKGRCRYCGVGVSLLYPLLELGTIFIAIAAIAFTDGMQTVMACVLGNTLLAIGVIEVRTRTIPNQLLFPLVFLGLVSATLVSTSNLIASVAGVAVAGAAVVLFAFAYQLLRGRPDFGGGTKLLIAAGAWVGWLGLPSVVVFASAAGLAAIFAAVLTSSASASTMLFLSGRVVLGPLIASGIWVVWLLSNLH